MEPGRHCFCARPARTVNLYGCNLGAPQYECEVAEQPVILPIDPTQLQLDVGYPNDQAGIHTVDEKV